MSGSGRWTPTNCPHCGHDGAFDGMGPFSRKTATRRLGDDGWIEKWERWDRMHCPSCGEQFAMLDKTVRIPHDEDGNEIEGGRELVTDGGTSDRERISDAQVGRCLICGETTLAAPHETEIVCKQCARDKGLRTDGGEPSHEELAEAEWRNIKNWCRQAILQNGDGLGAAMIIYFDEQGIGTIPFVHPEYDPREASLWMLGAFLAHLDDSTPDDFHPAEIADHALALMDDYKHDDLVGWSLETDENSDTGSCRSGGGA